MLRRKNLADKGWECRRVAILERVARKVLTEKRTLESRVGADRATERCWKAFRQGAAGAKGLSRNASAQSEQ